MLIKILAAGSGVIIIILGIFCKKLPIEKWEIAVEAVGDWCSSTGGIKIGKKLWEWIENFCVNIVDRLWIAFKKGLRRDNPKLLKKIEIVEKLRAKVKKEE